MQYYYNTHTLSSKFTGLCLDDDDVSADVIPLKFIELGGVVSPMLFTEGAREWEGDMSCNFTPAKARSI